VDQGLLQSTASSGPASSGSGWTATRQGPWSNPVSVTAYFPISRNESPWTWPVDRPVSAACRVQRSVSARSLRVRTATWLGSAVVTVSGSGRWIAS